MTLSEEVRIALDGKWRHVREQSRKELGEMDLLYDHDLTLDEARARVLEQMKKLVPTGIPAAGFRVEAWVDNNEAARAEAAAERARATPGERPALGIHVVVGPSFRDKLRNMQRAMAEDRTRLLNAVLVKP